MDKKKCVQNLQRKLKKLQANHDTLNKQKSEILQKYEKSTQRRQMEQLKMELQIQDLIIHTYKDGFENQKEFIRYITEKLNKKQSQYREKSRIEYYNELDKQLSKKALLKQKIDKLLGKDKIKIEIGIQSDKENINLVNVPPSITVIDDELQDKQQILRDCQQLLQVVQREEKLVDIIYQENHETVTEARCQLRNLNIVKKKIVEEQSKTKQYQQINENLKSELQVLEELIEQNQTCMSEKIQQIQAKNKDIEKDNINLKNEMINITQDDIIKQKQSKIELIKYQKQLYKQIENLDININGIEYQNQQIQEEINTQKQNQQQNNTIQQKLNQEFQAKIFQFEQQEQKHIQTLKNDMIKLIEYKKSLKDLNAENIKKQQIVEQLDEQIHQTKTKYSANFLQKNDVGTLNIQLLENLDELIIKKTQLEESILRLKIKNELLNESSEIDI